MLASPKSSLSMFKGWKGWEAWVAWNKTKRLSAKLGQWKKMCCTSSTSVLQLHMGLGRDYCDINRFLSYCNYFDLVHVALISVCCH